MKSICATLRGTWPAYWVSVSASSAVLPLDTLFDQQRCLHAMPRAAALDKRVKAVVAWRAMYHLRNYNSLPPLTADGFIFATGAKDLNGAKNYFESIDLDDVAGQRHCPLLIVHSGRDLVTPTENAMLMHERFRGSELLVFPDSGHCVHDRAHICRLQWLISCVSIWPAEMLGDRSKCVNCAGSLYVFSKDSHLANDQSAVRALLDMSFMNAIGTIYVAI